MEFSLGDPVIVRYSFPEDPTHVIFGMGEIIGKADHSTHPFTVKISFGCNKGLNILTGGLALKYIPYEHAILALTAETHPNVIGCFHSGHLKCEKECGPGICGRYRARKAKDIPPYVLEAPEIRTNYMRR